MRLTLFPGILLVFALNLPAALAAPRPGSPELPYLETEKSLIRLVPPGQPEPELVADQIVVKLAAGPALRATALPENALPEGVPELDTILTRHGIHDGFRVRRTRGTPIRDVALFRELGFDRLYVLQLPQADPAETFRLVAELSREPWVEYAHPVYRHVRTLTPNDTFFSTQWAHNNNGQADAFGTPDADMDSVEAWNTNPGDATGAVAILDTGVQMGGSVVTHPDLAANVDLSRSFDFVGDDAFPEDTNGHGTGAAGVAAAVGNNGIGVAGMCHGCQILVYKVSSNVDDADAIMAAADNGADTINMSHTFGCAWFQEILDATVYAAGLGTLSVASAANFDGYACSVPAAFPTVVSAGGTDQFDNRIFTFSDYAEVGAAGVFATSTGLGSSYVYFGGTSAASPYIAGLGALLRSERPDLHVNQLRHILRVGAEDEIGAPPDPPGWDLERGFGRVNANDSMSLLTTKWIALDRGHYHCEQDVTIALQDASGGPTIDVRISGDTSGDEEQVTLTRVSGTADYYEGTIGLNWSDVHGAGGTGDNLLDVTDGEILTAIDGVGSASAFLDCTKSVCRAPIRLDEGDCDLDGAADPGEDRVLRIHPVNLQTEPMEEVSFVVTTESPWIEILNPGATVGDLLPSTIAESPEPGSPRIRIRAGAPPDLAVTLEVEIFGRGFDADDADCKSQGWANDPVTLILNRDKGTSTGIEYDFEGLGNGGFSTMLAHGTGDLPECSNSYVNTWAGVASNGRVHQGSKAWGTSNPYQDLADGGLVSPPFTVPVAGGVLGWYHWLEAEWQDFGFNASFTWDGMIVEAKRTVDTTWTYLTDANYNHELFLNSCDAAFPFGAPGATQLRMFSGDGDGPLPADSYDQELQANLTQFAGEEIQVRWRFGSDQNTGEEGAWIDTITVYNSYAADSWPGSAPANLQGSDANCNVSFDLTADGVGGAGSYNWYRSEVSCLDAQQSGSVVASGGTPIFSDTNVAPDVEYFYAVQALEAAPTTCPSERSCVSGGCNCTTPPSDPTITGVTRTSSDVLFRLGYAEVFVDAYRDADKDPSIWGAPHESQIADQSASESDFQYTDVGGVAAGTIQYYIFTGSRCGITQPPRGP